MAHLGHDVVGVDIDRAKIQSLASGVVPFFEPGLEEMLKESLASGRLRFSSDVTDVTGATVHFIAVGTPQSTESGAADLRFIDAAFESIAPHLRAGDTVVGKSTVPVGTATRLQERLSEIAQQATLVWNPEFLREGFAIKDTLSPDRIVYGLAAGDTRSEVLLDEVYRSALDAGTPKVVTDFATAELVKVAANAFLATKISFINAMADVADASGADVTQLADAIGFDQRIGRRFLNAGLGFGGGCLPKDIRGFIARGDELGVGGSLTFLGEVDRINTARRDRIVQLALESFGGAISGKRIAVLGLSFKPNSDDVRDSPALDVALRLSGLGAHVIATDPAAVPVVERLQTGLELAGTTAEALAGAELVMLLTEWGEYRDLDPRSLSSVVGRPAIIDGRNVLDPLSWRAEGWDYSALGRP